MWNVKCYSSSKYQSEISSWKWGWPCISVNIYTPPPEKKINSNLCLHLEIKSHCCSLNCYSADPQLNTTDHHVWRPVNKPSCSGYVSPSEAHFSFIKNYLWRKRVWDSQTSSFIFLFLDFCLGYWKGGIFTSLAFSVFRHIIRSKLLSVL